VKVFMPAAKLVFSSQAVLSSTIPQLLAGPEADAIEQTLSQKVSERARLIFEQSGSTPGNDEANWLRAESEILRPGFEVRESGTWMTLNACIPSVSGQGMQIVVRPTRVIVRAKETSDGQSSSEPAEQGQREIALAVNLAVEVDPSSAAASFRDHTLRLMIKKRRPDNLTASSTPASK
jgi:HSP20 family molecular chaperone IbpA